MISDMDYRSYLDAEVLGFIDRMNGFYPPESLALPMAENRRIYDRMSAVFREAPPENVTAQTLSLESPAGSVPGRLYQREVPDNRAAILYFHGGGFVLGGLESHDDICAETCARTGFQVLAVDYRLAPEHPAPAARQDAIAAYQGLVEAGTPPAALARHGWIGLVLVEHAHDARVASRRAVPLTSRASVSALAAWVGRGLYRYLEIE
mgnify:CR=1 FL=1